MALIVKGCRSAVRVMEKRTVPYFLEISAIVPRVLPEWSAISDKRGMSEMNPVVNSSGKATISVPSGTCPIRLATALRFLSGDARTISRGMIDTFICSLSICYESIGGKLVGILAAEPAVIFLDFPHVIISIPGWNKRMFYRYCLRREIDSAKQYRDSRLPCYL